MLVLVLVELHARRASTARAADMLAQRVTRGSMQPHDAASAEQADLARSQQGLLLLPRSQPACAQQAAGALAWAWCLPRGSGSSRPMGQAVTKHCDSNASTLQTNKLRLKRGARGPRQRPHKRVRRTGYWLLSHLFRVGGGGNPGAAG